ncbi:gluconokinase [Kwoniella heveanensis BCC8398]|uniref:gluconokinase n=1 Tax=Kwoniella heveanensis BCC8398 TaxID=1296120 RepID=A0A1B9H2I7_9TREE|nr:gluconokinase [Kwoniella heveanensis BCC8398]
MSATTEFKPEAEDRPDLTVPLDEPNPVLIIVMGPASCGKSTVGSELAESLSIPFIDGDSLHPSSNIDKMSRGIPLTDEDRLPWLALIRSTAERKCKEEYEKCGGKFRGVAEGGIGRAGVVIACSALRKWYRDILRGQIEANPPSKDDLPPAHPTATSDLKVHHPATSALETYFVYCHGTPEVLEARIAARKGHFMGKQMLASQLATLEDPRGEDGVVTVEIDATPEEVGRTATEGVKKLVGR